MELKQLRALIAVERWSNITRAAEQLGISQPALGMQLSALEEALGVKLLERHSRGVHLSTAGRHLASRAKEILSLTDRVRIEVMDMAERPHGTIRVGMSPSASLLLAMDLITVASAAMPDVKLKFVENSSAVTLEWLDLNRIDLAFVFGTVRHKTFDAQILLNERLCYVAASGDAPNYRSITLSEIASGNMILPGGSDTVRQAIDRAASSLGLTLNILFEMQSIHTAIDFVARRYGATILPAALIKRLRVMGDFDVRPIIEPDIVRPLSMVHTRDRELSKAERQLISISRKLIREKQKSLEPSWYTLTL
ncbi:LysR family nitrogen assimilation transcriptional regulator [Pseudochelatococcus lubricantis]|uniref:LysR family nitrogen assimilation transcriptional regulator n=1 Tax=Pseudochelatococcus lubricantis TaxID=1538102 RepID=A0ABX0UUI8_9HYPH|nr:LysR family transcriptional regulator [Pseudochelatococcus lubricantis]NIJ56617.1 LysR family nitrogen assimilation transcriptional regulator [Pseudochelatococcus lubricantis]